MIEIYQTGQIAELAVQVKLSARKIDTTVAKGRIECIKIALLIVTPFFIALGVVDTYCNVVGSEVDWSDYIYVVASFTKVTVLVTISTTLIVVSCCLISNINAYFEKEMKDEAQRIKTVSIIFPITYFTRAIAYWVLPSSRLSGFTFFVNRKYVNTVNNDSVVATFLTLYLFWDILPLSLVMFNHYKVFSAQEKHLKDRAS